MINLTEDRYNELREKAEKWDKRADLLKNEIGLTDEQAKRFSDDIHKSQIQVVSEVMEENKQLKEGFDERDQKVNDLRCELEGLIDENFTLKETIEKTNYEINRVLVNVKSPMVSVTCEESINRLYLKLKKILNTTTKEESK
jgi:phage shock protein A